MPHSASLRVSREIARRARHFHPRCECGHDYRAEAGPVEREASRLAGRNELLPQLERGTSGSTGAHPLAPPPTCLSCLRSHLSSALRELLAELLGLLQRFLLVLEVLLQQRDDVLLAHRLGVRDQALVSRDLVVL